MGKTFWRHLSLLLIWSCLLSIFILYYNQGKNFTVQDHSFHLSLLPFLLMSLLSFLLLGGMWVLSAKFLSSSFSLPYQQGLSLDFLSYLPLFFLLLIPFVSFHYLSSGDLLMRLKLHGLATLFFIFTLKFATVFLLARDKPFFLDRIIQRITSLSLRRKLVLLFVVALLFYGIGSAVLVTKGINFSGDQSHYLLITHSVLTDGDFDLSNNYSNHDYDRFMRPDVRISPHVAPGTEGKYSFHSPGLSFLLLPAYSLGSLFNRTAMNFIIRCGMSVFGALLGIQIFLFALQEWKKEGLAFGLWFLFGFTSPVFFYALHIYPEIVVTLFSLTTFRLLRFQKSFTKLQLLGLGFLLSAIIWLHAVKYVFIFIPLFLYAFWVLVIKQKIRWNILYFLFFPLCLFSLHIAFSSAFYNSVSPFAVSIRGPSTTTDSITYIRSLFVDIPFRYRWETLLSYFLDQRDGLLLYAPLYFFAFLGMIEMGKRRFRDLGLVLCLTGLYILNLAFLTQRPAYAPQARTLVAVFWGMAVFLGYFLAHNAKKIFTYIFSLFAFFSLLTTLLLLRTPRALYQPTTVGETERAGLLFLQLSNLHYSLPKFLPSFLKIEDSFWPPNIVWVVLTVLFILAYKLTKKHSFPLKYSHFLSGSMIGLGVFYLWFVFYPRTVIVHPQNIAYPSGEKITFYAYSRSARMTSPGVFDLIEDNRLYSFYFSSWRELPDLHLDFGSEKGVYTAEIKYFDQTIFRGQTRAEIKTLRFPPVPPYTLKNQNLYHISIFLDNRSDIDTQESPYRFSILPVR
ncbi:MAG: hypothetical protein KAT01_10565 [Candidatus Aminicenantes bacterium]|nr:hypothetical protein [Candidatus Aminicenantes bacterium]